MTHTFALRLAGVAWLGSVLVAMSTTRGAADTNWFYQKQDGHEHGPIANYRGLVGATGSQWVVITRVETDSPVILRAPTASGGDFDTLFLPPGSHRNLRFYASGGDMKYVMRGPGRKLELYGQPASPQPRIVPRLFYSKEDGNTDGSIANYLSVSARNAGKVRRIRKIEVDQRVRLTYPRSDGQRVDVSYPPGTHHVNLAATGDDIRYHIAQDHFVLKLWGEEEY